jgi:hypothetical protein
MQNDGYQPKRRRGSSPYEEMNQRLDDWVRGLRSVTQFPKGYQRIDSRKKLTDQESGAGCRSDDKGPWQDDGGESGEAV